MKNVVLPLVSLLFYVVVTSDTRGTDYSQYFIYYDELPITAEPGSIAEFGCVFDHAADFKPTHLLLRKCKPLSNPIIYCEDDPTTLVFNSADVNATTDEFRHRVALMVPDLSKKNCSIRFNDLTISMNGSYLMEVRGQRNGRPELVLTILEKPIKVTGLRQPRIIGQTSVEQGRNLTLTCMAQSSPPSDVIWTVDGSDIPLMSGNQTATLFIPMVTPGNSGKYICTAKHLNKTKTTFTHVFVICTNYSEGIYYDEDHIITAEPGTSVQIGCAFNHCAEFEPTAVILRKCEPGSFCEDDNNIIFNSEDVNATMGGCLVALMESDLSKKNCSIRIDDLSIYMNGSYQIGLKGQRNGLPASINTQRKKLINVTGLRQPRIIGQTSVEQGRNLILTCTAESSPPSDVIWTVDGSDNPLMSGHQTATLFIPMVTPENSVKYICTAKHLNETKTTFTHVFVICTNYSEGIYYDEDHIITAEPGTSVQIGCAFNHCAEFEPTAVILRKCEPGSFCEDDNNIIFNSEDVNAAMGGCLVALMESDLSKKNCSIRIDDISIYMNGSYQIGLKGQRNGRPASINTQRKKLINVTGLRRPRIIGQTSVTLTCTAQSSPPSDVVWTVDGSDTPLMSGNQIATLFIPMVTRENSGKYICTAKHLNETKTTFTHVFVICTKYSDQVIIYYDEDRIITAEPGTSVGLVALMESDLSKKNCSIRIDDLTKSMNGSHQIGLKGQRNGRPASINTQRKKPIKVTGLRQPRIIGQTSVEQGNLTLTCMAQSSPPSDVIWTVDGSDTPLMIGNQTATLFIPMVTPENSGKYICTAKHLNETKTTFTHVFVISRSYHGTLALAAIVFLVVAVALNAMIWHWFFRCRKSCRDQTDFPEMVIPQDQQTGDGVHGHEQNVQEGGQDQLTWLMSRLLQTAMGVTPIHVTQPFPRLQMSILPPSAQGVLPPPSTPTRSPALATPPPPVAPKPSRSGPPPPVAPKPSRSGPPPPVAPKPSRSGPPPPVAPKPSRSGPPPPVAPKPSRSGPPPPVAPKPSRSGPPPPVAPKPSRSGPPPPVAPKPSKSGPPRPMVSLDQILLGKKRL